MVALAVGVKYGALCASCRQGCANCYSELTPAVLEDHQCGTCRGKREVDGVICKACRGSGNELITSCPQAIITRETWAALTAAEDYRRGFLPVAGGTADQSASAMEAIRAAIMEEAGYRIEVKMEP